MRLRDKEGGRDGSKKKRCWEAACIVQQILRNHPFRRDGRSGDGRSQGSSKAFCSAPAGRRRAYGCVRILWEGRRLFPASVQRTMDVGAGGVHFPLHLPASDGGGPWGRERICLPGRQEDGSYRTGPYVHRRFLCHHLWWCWWSSRKGIEEIKLHENVPLHDSRMARVPGQLPGPVEGKIPLQQGRAENAAGNDEGVGRTEGRSLVRPGFEGRSLHWIRLYCSRFVSLFSSEAIFSTAAGWWNSGAWVREISRHLLLQWKTGLTSPR